MSRLAVLVLQCRCSRPPLGKGGSEFDVITHKSLEKV